MAFEPVYSLLSPSYPQRLASGQAVIEARLLPAGFTVGRVLSASADVGVVPGEVFTGEARYSGKANFRVLVLDGDGVCRSLDYVAEFSDKLTGENITAGMQPVFGVSVLDTDIVLATEHEIKLACVAEVQCSGVGGAPVSCLTSGGEGVYTHDDRVAFTRLSGRGNESHSFSDTVAVPGMEELLFVEPRCVVVKRAVDTDCVRVEGVIVTDVTGRSGDTVLSVRQETPFSAELSAAGAHGGDVCVMQAAVQSSRAELTFGDEPSVVCDVSLSFSYCTFSEDALDPVCDAFSVTHELLISGESVKVPLPLGDETFFERVEGKVTLDDNMPPADKILAVCGCRLGLTDAIAADGKLTVEGMAECALVYATEEGQKASATVQLPFSLTVSAPLREGDVVSAHGVITSVDVKVRRDGALEIKADIAVEYSATREEVKYVITDLAQGEERALPTGAVAIHIARKGETLWDAAKALGATPETVLLQNPGIELPLNGGERVITYRCQTKPV